MSERLPKHLDDALYAARLALRFVGGRTLAEYRADELLRSAVERQVGIVREACRRALADSPTLVARLPDAARAVAMRNRIVLDYDTIDDALVFDTVISNFSALASELEQELKRVG